MATEYDFGTEEGWPWQALPLLSLKVCLPAVVPAAQTVAAFGSISFSCVLHKPCFSNHRKQKLFVPD